MIASHLGLHCLMMNGKCSKILNTFLFLFSKKMVIRVRIHKMLVRKADREDPDQKQYDLGLDCLSRLLRQATTVLNFRTFTVTVPIHWFTAKKGLQVC